MIKDTVKRKAYHKGYWKEYYADPERRKKHLQAVRKNEKVRALKTREWLNNYKLEKGCKICGFREHPAALDFAHKDRSTKLYNVSNLAIKGFSKKRLQIEIDKCDILCANHHRITTAEENKILGH